MESLITYYGGKQKVLKHILPLITALLLTACLPLKHTQPTRQSHVDSVFVQRLVPIPMPSDTSLLRALLRCNAEGRVAMERLSIETTRNARLAFLLDSLGELQVETIVQHDTVWAKADSVFINRDVVREVVREVERKPTRWERFVQGFGTGSFWACIGALAFMVVKFGFRIYRRRLPL